MDASSHSQHNTQRPSTARPTATNHALKHKSPDTDASPDAASSRPPAKRVRKAVNCEPCRASKLKCDKQVVLCVLLLASPSLIGLAF